MQMHEHLETIGTSGAFAGTNENEKISVFGIIIDAVY